MDYTHAGTPNDPSLARRTGMHELLLQRVRAQVDPSLDGGWRGMWILFNVNHFELRQERVIVLTDRSVLRIKVNFKTYTVERSTRLPLAELESVTFGPMQLAEGSWSEAAAAKMGLATNHQMHGLDAVYGTMALRLQLTRDTPLSAWQRYNPTSKAAGARRLLPPLMRTPPPLPVMTSATLRAGHTWQLPAALSHGRRRRRPARDRAGRRGGAGVSPGCASLCSLVCLRPPARPSLAPRAAAHPMRPPGAVHAGSRGSLGRQDPDRARAGGLTGAISPRSPPTPHHPTPS